MICAAVTRTRIAERDGRVGRAARVSTEGRQHEKRFQARDRVCIPDSESLPDRGSGSSEGGRTSASYVVGFSSSSGSAASELSTVYRFTGRLHGGIWQNVNLKLPLSLLHSLHYAGHSCFSVNPSAMAVNCTHKSFFAVNAAPSNSQARQDP
jgi:hypothetical protein